MYNNNNLFCIYLKNSLDIYDEYQRGEWNQCTFCLFLYVLKPKPLKLLMLKQFENKKTGEGGYNIFKEHDSITIIFQRYYITILIALTDYYFDMVSNVCELILLSLPRCIRASILSQYILYSLSI